MLHAGVAHSLTDSAREGATLLVGCGVMVGIGEGSLLMESSGISVGCSDSCPLRLGFGLSVDPSEGVELIDE